MMIPAYNMAEVEEYFQQYRDENMENYLQNEEGVKGAENVRIALLNYIHKIQPSENVETLLQGVMHNENLLQKTQIVYDGSFRNCTLLIFPREWHSTCSVESLNTKDVEEMLFFFEEHAEVLFLNIDRYRQSINDEICFEPFDFDFLKMPELQFDPFDAYFLSEK